MIELAKSRKIGEKLTYHRHYQRRNRIARTVAVHST